MTCVKFNNNMIKIQKYLTQIKKYINHTQVVASHFIGYTKDLNTYSAFVADLKYNVDTLLEFKQYLDHIIEYKLTPTAIAGLGHSLSCFYKLYSDLEYNDAFLYSFGFNGYIDNIEGFVENIRDGFICPAKITNKVHKAKFKNAYYPVLMHSDPVKNSYDLKNMIVTGPNAAGKTTLLKTTLINVILGQQTGCGFYESATLFPFDFIHCYLNIPDTSGRDSLFQAECRRCKDILDTIAENDDCSHFCVFDELYSGTNPDEAVSSSKAFMKYLIKRKKITCVLTTHFTKICDDLEKENIKNFYMYTVQNGNDFTYSFKLKEGISTIKGGVKVLKDMNFPDEILNSFTKE